MNQDLKLCASRGHAIYLPSDNEPLKTQLYANSVSDPSSVSGYRCLRCGNFIPVSALKDTEPKRLPLAEIPLIPRGNHNRKLYSLKLIAMERWIRAAFIFVVALGLFRLTSSSNHLYASLVDLTKAAQPLADKLGFNTSQSHTLHLIENSLTWSSSKYITLGAAVDAI